MRTFAFTLMNMPMMPDAIEHAAPTRNAIPVRIPSSGPKTLVSATFAVSDNGDEHRDPDRGDEGKDRDGRVLAPDERDGPLEDRRRDVLHRLRAGVAPQHVTGEEEGEGHGDEPGGQDDELERAWIHGC